ncbi:hypothetical protein TRIP_B120012 [uncultured Desulfatiglans sp.]|uniref:Uncharacterized protein n=1 Tax=Uncultured Desulfatiglans sp. TaxID=1748965 RepID=A0A653A0L1_UNCDX|nr:hypothetical protein TRIP_B120012 [uncultured Desulfatiglans sp.]
MIFATGLSQTVSQTCRKDQPISEGGVDLCDRFVTNSVANLSQRLIPFRQPVEQLVGFTLGDDQFSVHHRFQVSLQRASKMPSSS